MKERVPYKVYRLGEGYPVTAEGKPLYSWPYTVHFAPDYPGNQYCLGEGDGRNGSGSFFPASTILEPRWRDHLEKTNTLWLIPFLERDARGEIAPPEEVLKAYQELHGALPPEEHWQL